jgi:hypothetical protein
VDLRRGRALVTAAAFALLATPVLAAPGIATRTAPSGFTATLAVTTDTAWLGKWKAASGNDLGFAGATSSHTGEKATVLLFVDHPAIIGGRAKVLCGITVGNAKAVVEKLPVHVCYGGPVFPGNGPILADFEASYVPKASDTPGPLTFELAVDDANAHIELPLSVSIPLDGNGKR